MEELLERKLENYQQVIETLEEFASVWNENPQFEKAVNQLKKVSKRPDLDIYLADHILKFKLDFQMFQFRKKHECFFQKYFCSRIMGAKAIAA